MTFRLIPLAALAGVAVTPAAASAAEVQIAATGPVVELTVTENETGSPDLATLDAGGSHRRAGDGRQCRTDDPRG
jgi:uncharacterized protein YggE